MSEAQKARPKPCDYIKSNGELGRIKAAKGHLKVAPTYGPARY